MIEQRWRFTLTGGRELSPERFVARVNSVVVLFSV